MWIEFDIPAIISLTKDYQKTMEFIKDELPSINIDSRIEVKDYFQSEFEIPLKRTSIEYLKEWANILEDDSEAKFVLTGLIEYYKLYYTINNYLMNIIKHQQGGRVCLRKVDGKTLMPNKRELPRSPDIVACIEDVSPDLKSYLKDVQNQGGINASIF